MTTKKLIEKLMEMPQDLEVMTVANDLLTHERVEAVVHSTVDGEPGVVVLGGLRFARLVN